jgi:hypothetical protein
MLFQGILIPLFLILFLLPAIKLPHKWFLVTDSQKRTAVRYSINFAGNKAAN